MMAPKNLLLALIGLAVLAGSIYQFGGFKNRKADGIEIKSNMPPSIELTDSDVIVAQRISMTQGLPISGT